MNRKIRVSIAGAAVVMTLATGAFILKPDPVEAPAADLTATAQPIVDVAVPDTLSNAATRGKRAFEAKCAACHGPNAAGTQGIAPPLVHKIYEPSHHGDAAFLSAAQNGARAHHWPFGNMAPVDGITTADIKDVTVYVRELQRHNGIE